MCIYDQFVLDLYYLFQVNVNNHQELKQEDVQDHLKILFYELILQDYMIIENPVVHN